MNTIALNPNFIQTNAMFADIFSSDTSITQSLFDLLQDKANKCYQYVAIKSQELTASLLDNRLFDLLKVTTRAEFDQFIADYPYFVQLIINKYQNPENAISHKTCDRILYAFIQNSKKNLFEEGFWDKASTQIKINLKEMKNNINLESNTGNIKRGLINIENYLRILSMNIIGLQLLKEEGHNDEKGIIQNIQEYVLIRHLFNLIHKLSQNNNQLYKKNMVNVYENNKSIFETTTTQGLILLIQELAKL